MSDRKVKVLYIAGEGRSGSTLLSNILGKIDGFFSAGELSWIWLRGLKKNEPCGCGTPFHECPLWSEIIDFGFADFSERRVNELIEMWRVSTRTRRLIEYVLSGRKAPRKKEYHIYLDALESLYHAISNVTDCEFIVDSSKSPAYAYLLSSIQSLDLFVIHLVRDSRAVAYSRSREKIRPEDGSPMVRFSPAFSSINWSIVNMAAEWFWSGQRAIGRYIRVRYEDFVQNPEAVLASVIDSIDFRGQNGPNTADLTIHKKIHSVSGNPMRFNNGPLHIRLDDEWSIGMDKSRKALVTLITLPFLIRYKYL